MPRVLLILVVAAALGGELASAQAADPPHPFDTPMSADLDPPGDEPHR